MQYSDLPQAERSEILRFVSELPQKLSDAFIAAGGEVRGQIIDFILAGSWANNRALENSDIDIITVVDRHDAFYHADSRIAQNILNKARYFDQRDYNGLNHFIDMRSFGTIRIIHQGYHPENARLGFSLLTGQSYLNEAEVRMAHGL